MLEFKGRRRTQWQPAAAEVTVLTPRATVAVLAAGYRPVLHPTAGAPLAGRR